MDDSLLDEPPAADSARSVESEKVSIWKQTPVRKVAFIIACLSCNYGMLMPILPGIKTRFFTETAHCGDACASMAAEVSGIFDSLAAFMGAIFLPLIGRWSDKVGRKRPLVILTVVNLLPTLALFLYVSMGWTLYVYFGVLIFSLGARGSTGVVNAIMADCSDKESRQRAFAGILLISVGSFALMPSFGISLHQTFGEAALVGLVAVIGALGVAVALWFDETLTTQSTAADEELADARELQIDDAAPVEISYWNSCAWPQVTNLRLACLICMLSMFSMSGMVEIVLFYVKSYLHFTLRQNANMILCIGISSTLLQFFLAISPKSFDDKTLVLVGLAANVLHLIGFSLATNALMMYASELLSGLSQITLLGLHSMISKRADETQQGTVMGILNSVSTLAGVFAPAFFGFVFGVFRDPFPVAPFVLGSILTSTAFLCALKLKR